MENSLYNTNITIIENEVLEYLFCEKSEYLKVFMFLLYKGNKKPDIKDMADELELTEQTIEKAIKLFIKRKFIGKGVISMGKKKDEIDFNTKNKKELKEIENDLLFIAEKILGQTLTDRQMSLIAKCYNDYNFTEDIILYLLEYCASKGIKTYDYMNSIATSWYENGIKTIEEAKKFTENYNKNTSKKNKKPMLNPDNEYGHYLEDVIVIINHIRNTIKEEKIKNFDELVEYYIEEIDKNSPVDDKDTTEEQDIKAMNLKVYFDYIYKNPNFFANLFTKE